MIAGVLGVVNFNIESSGGLSEFLMTNLIEGHSQSVFIDQMEELYGITSLL